MAMNACNNCLENDWSFELIEGWVRATCNNCSNEIEFPKRKKKEMNEGDSCRKCSGRVIYKESKFKKSKLEKPYYFTGFYKCKRCGTFYMAEKFKVYN